MKVFLILAAAFAVANAGVRELSPRDEQNILQLWAQYCAGGSEGQVAGDTQVYCKVSRDNPTENQVHRIRLNGDGGNRNQVIFVKPPSYNYNHQIQIEGGNGGSQSSTIYVLPQKNTHNVQHTYTPGSGVTANKPTVYFLKGNNGGATGTSGTAGPSGGY